MKYKQTWDKLAEVIESISYRRDEPPDDRLYKRFELRREDENNYAVLYIFTYNINTYDESKMRYTRHEFVVPIATYHAEMWTRWVFDCIMKIEMHETTEWFFVNGERVYAPHHGNGWDPYTFWPAHDVAEKIKAPGED